MVFMFLDVEKAFDNVSWSFLMKVLQNMNCEDKYLNWMWSIYTDQHIRILVNGSLSKKTEITKRTQQGCPISLLLFILVMEILAIKITWQHPGGIFFTFGHCIPICRGVTSSIAAVPWLAATLWVQHRITLPKN